jgi:6-carboxyhexanoate--CoA ligase
MSFYNVKMRASKEDSHISGAERIVKEQDIKEAVVQLIDRAFNHSRGKPDFVNIKVELIKESIKEISLLPVFEVSGSYDVSSLLLKISKCAGLTEEVVLNAYNTLLEGAAPDGSVMRGAMIVSVPDGNRLEPDKFKGVRATCLDISLEAQRQLKKAAGEKYTENLKEALTLTSKILFYPDVLAELCISDDPDYTTGYFSVKGVGYFRLFNVKPKGHLKGGRAIFVRKGCNVEKLITYLKETPVIATKFSGYSVVSVNEVCSVFKKSPV